MSLGNCCKSQISDKPLTEDKHEGLFSEDCCIQNNENPTDLRVNSQYANDKNGLEDKLPNVPRFVILGKPATGKSNLAKRLSSIWGCEYINASHLICENIDKETALGSELRNLMSDGHDLDDDFVIRILTEKLDSPECISKGYILDDIPNHSEKTISIPKQLDMLLKIRNSANCFIYIQAPDDQHRLWWAKKRIDPLTGNIYELMYPAKDQKRPVPRLLSQDCRTLNAVIDPELKNRLLTRHEELPESLDAHFKFHNDVVLPALQEFFTKLETTPIICIEGSSEHKDLFENTISALYEYSDKTDLGLLNLFGDLNEEGVKNAEFTQLSAQNKSKWQKLRDALLCHQNT